jgi:hypothetical protein
MARSKESQKKRSLYFARKQIKKNKEPRYKEIEPGVFIKTI